MCARDDFVSRDATNSVVPEPARLSHTAWPLRTSRGDSHARDGDDSVRPAVRRLHDHRLTQRSLQVHRCCRGPGADHAHPQQTADTVGRPDRRRRRERGSDIALQCRGNTSRLSCQRRQPARGRCGAQVFHVNGAAWTALATLPMHILMPRVIQQAKAAPRIDLLNVGQLAEGRSGHNRPRPTDVPDPRWHGGTDNVTSSRRLLTHVGYAPVRRQRKVEGVAVRGEQRSRIAHRARRLHDARCRAPDQSGTGTRIRRQQPSPDRQFRQPRPDRAGRRSARGVDGRSRQSPDVL